MTTLHPGDKVYFRQNGRRLRATVVDFLNLRTRGESIVIPITRRKEVIWKQRTELRKLPTKK